MLSRAALHCHFPAHARISFAHTQRALQTPQKTQCSGPTPLPSPASLPPQPAHGCSSLQRHHRRRLSPPSLAPQVTICEETCPAAGSAHACAAAALALSTFKRTINLASASAVSAAASAAAGSRRAPPKKKHTKKLAASGTRRGNKKGSCRGCGGLPARGAASSLRNASISELFRELALALQKGRKGASRSETIVSGWRRHLGMNFCAHAAGACLRLFIRDDRRPPRTGTGQVSSTALNALNVLLLLLPTSPAKSQRLMRRVSDFPVTVDRSAP